MEARAQAVSERWRQRNITGDGVEKKEAEEMGTSQRETDIQPEAYRARKRKKAREIQEKSQRQGEAERRKDREGRQRSRVETKGNGIATTTL